MSQLPGITGSVPNTRGITNPTFPIPIKSPRNPTTNDKGPIGQIWINLISNGAFILTSIVNNLANWVSIIGGVSALETLTGDTGGAVGPTMNNITITGAGGISVTGTPGTSSFVINNSLSSSNASFSAYLSATVNNVTGDGTTYGPIVYNTELYDNGSVYNNATGIFTAPKTGLYCLQFSMVFADISGSTVDSFILTTTSKTYLSHSFNLWLNGADGFGSGNYTVFAPMTAGDTASTSILFSGGTKTVDLIGDGTNPYTQFSGYLIS